MAGGKGQSMELNDGRLQGSCESGVPGPQKVLALLAQKVKYQVHTQCPHAGGAPSAPLRLYQGGPYRVPVRAKETTKKYPAAASRFKCCKRSCHAAAREDVACPGAPESIRSYLSFAARKCMCWLQTLLLHEQVYYTVVCNAISRITVRVYGKHKEGKALII